MAEPFLHAQALVGRHTYLHMYFRIYFHFPTLNDLKYSKKIPRPEELPAFQAHVYPAYEKHHCECPPACRKAAF